MRKLAFALIAIFFITVKLIASDAVSVMGAEAKAFLKAQDYEKAGSLYEQVLTFDLPSWQRALALYNLGTVKLAQKHNKEALHFYELVSIEAVSNPMLFRALYLNKGIAYFNQAQELSVPANSYEFAEQLNFYQDSFSQLEEAQRLDCLLQEFEGVFSSHCQASRDVEAYFKKAQMAIQQNKTQQRANLIKDAHTSPSTPLAQLLLHYRLTLLQDELTLSSLQNLLSEQKQIQEKSTEIEKAGQYLEISLGHIKNNQKEEAGFFLLGAFDLIKRLENKPKEDPKQTLIELLMQALRAKKLTRLSLKLSIQDPSLVEALVKDAQVEVVKMAKDFPSLILAVEQKAFKNPDSQAEHCQHQPWNQVFPLFDKGYQAAVAAAAQPFPLLAEQDKVLTNWKEALHILSQPPSPSASNQAKSSSVSETQNLLKIIQEMQAQDQPIQEPTYQERHSW